MKRSRNGGDSEAPFQKKANTGMPKVQDALGYLERVKSRYVNEPAVYNQFLDIMKDFKSQAIDTEGVIKRVISLFKGNRNLILGFNQFLPPGYKIELDPELPPKQKPTVEFNHAVQYVAKIKNRFIHQPKIYSEFLDILHDYQAKKTIDEVYSRVQNLFGQHEDLLREFKHFLPDNSGQTNMQQKRGQKNQKKITKKPFLDPAKGKMRRKDGSAILAQGKKVIPNSFRRDDKDKQMQPPPVDTTGKRFMRYPAGSQKEQALLEKIKTTVSRSQWAQMLKCLNLFSVEVISRTELVGMVEDILGSDLANRFRDAIGFNNDMCNEYGEERGSEQRQNYYQFVSSSDFKNCKEVTPSYRQLPDEIAAPPCSGRTTLSDNVLNDKCICYQPRSEDFSFKSTRKNIYEENLFKCEDERFELDMVIENNAAAIRVLEPIVEEVHRLSPEQAKHIRLSKNTDIMHTRAIARVYGDHGFEIIELLKRRPAACAPVVLTRLKQRDEEWRRVRHEMKPVWRRTNENNFQRSLDHRSIYFKQEDKKRRQPKQLVNELREVHMKAFGPKDESEDENSDVESELVRKLNEEDESPLYTYCMRFKYGDDSIHDKVYDILSHVAATQLSEEDQQKFHTFWVGFVHHIFGCKVKSAAEKKEEEDLAKTAELEKKQAEAAASKEAGDENPTVTRVLRETRRKKDDLDEEGEEEEEEPENEDDEKDDPEGVKKAAKALQKRKRRKRTKKKQKKKDRDDGDSDNSDSDEDKKCLDPPINMEILGDTNPQQKNMVKPLRVMMETWELEEKLNPVRRHTRPSRLFFGNNAYYVFFRLHQLLYERTEIAKNLTAEKHTRSSSKAKPLPSSPEGRYSLFNNMLVQLLDGEMDAAKFEDELRIWLGASSYMLFTLDKLIVQLVQQVQTLLMNSTCMQLLSLYQYEHCRSKSMEMPNLSTITNTSDVETAVQVKAEDIKDVASEDEQKTLERSAELARIYHSNCASLLGDDSCCQIEFFEDTFALGIGLIDGFLVSEPKSMGQEFAVYLEDFMNSPPSIPAGKTPPFLIRNFKHYLAAASSKSKKGRGRRPVTKPGSTSQPPSSREQLITTLNSSVFDESHRIECDYGLEAQICANTYKLSFREDTEDYFIRHRYPFSPATSVMDTKDDGEEQAQANDSAWQEYCTEAATRQKAKSKRRERNARQFQEWCQQRLEHVYTNNAGDGPGSLSSDDTTRDATAAASAAAESEHMKD